MKKRTVFKYLRYIVILFFCVTLAMGCYHTLKSNPKGTDYKSQPYHIHADDIDFLFDLTYKGDDDKVISEQEIFDRIFSLVDQAEKYILLDMFLYNSYIGKIDHPYRNLVAELTSRLITKKNQNSDIKIDFITDPINKVYGGSRSKELTELQNAGINAIYTDMRKLRDSNILYSPIWRLLFKWMGNSSDGGLCPHPFSDKEVPISLRSYLELLNFKANHRKIFVADHHDEPIAIITSANPHDGSSAHSNVALEIKGEFAKELYIAEKAVARFSGKKLISRFGILKTPNKRTDDSIYVQLLTEKKIKDELVRHIDLTGKKDLINIAVFYLSDRETIKALLQASGRGVHIRLILDPNKDAFGREKNGIPNRQVARELRHKSGEKILIRWYDTHGEQFHTKLAHFDFHKKSSVAILGSANFTRRNLDNFNLELNVLLSAPSNNRTISEIRQYFNKIWGDKKYTADNAKYEEHSLIKLVIYRFWEASGFATF